MIKGQEQRQQLDIARLEEHLRSVPHQVLSAVGDTSDVLFRLVQDNQIDLLVLGTHGRTGLPKLLMGSVAEKIFRQSPIPVLTIGPHVPRERSAKKFSRFVFATDLSDESLAALPHAMAFVQDHNAHLTVLHVLDGTTKGTVDFEAGAEFALRQMQELVPIDPELGIYPDYCGRVWPGGRSDSSILRGTRCGRSRPWRARAAWRAGNCDPPGPYDGAAHRRAPHLSCTDCARLSRRAVKARSTAN